MTESTESKDISLAEMLTRLAEDEDFDLRGYKDSTLERRLRKRMGQLGINAFSDYLKHFTSDPKERTQLLNTVLINVTEFFRDPLAWEAFAREVVYPLLKSRDPRHPFRAWVAGCSTGE